MKKYLVIKADENDGDYFVEMNEISDKKLLSFQKLIDAISKFKEYEGAAIDEIPFKHHHNFPCGEFTREDLGEKTAEEMYVGGKVVDQNTFDDFMDFVPCGSTGIHTIVSIKVIEVAKEKVLFGY